MPPELREKMSDDLVLLRLGHCAERRARHTNFEQHRVERVVGVEESNDEISVPMMKTRDLVRGLHVWHPELEDGVRSVGAHGGGNPRAGSLAAEGCAERQRPSPLEVGDDVRQTS